jgi:hypothetical protein
MSRRARHILIGVVLVAFFLLRDDFWLADDPRLLLGLPVGLLYHASYCLAASALMAWLIAVVRPFENGAGK